MAKSRHPRRKTRRLQGWLMKPKGSLYMQDMYMFPSKEEAEKERPGEDWEVISAELRFPR